MFVYQILFCRYFNKEIGDHNFCRNPDEKYDKTWCYTSFGRRENQWDFCYVPICYPGKNFLSRQKSNLKKFCSLVVNDKPACITLSSYVMVLTRVACLFKQKQKTCYSNMKQN